MGRPLKSADRDGRARRPGPDLRKLAGTLLATFGLILLVFTGYQAYTGWHYTRGKEAMATASLAVVTALNGRLDAQRAATEAIAVDPRVVASVGTPGAERVVRTIHGEHPEMDRLLLLPSAVEFIEPEPYPGPDFAAVAAAIRAKNGEASRPVVSGAGARATTNWAAGIGPMGPGIVPRGFVVASWRLSELVAELERMVGNGYLDLRYTRASGAYDVLAFAGSVGVGYTRLEARPARPPFAVGYMMPRPFLSLTRSLAEVALLALVGIALLAGGYTLRNGTGWIARLRGGDTDDTALDVDEPMLSEIVDEELQEAMEFASEIREASGKPSASEVDREIFRAYDIRGVVGRTLSANVAQLIGQAVGSEAQARGIAQIVVGRDGRLSSPELSKALITGLAAAGMDVMDIGDVPTGVLYFATHQLETGSGVMVTGSHNPPDYNGFKIMLGGETLSGEAIAALYARIVEDDLVEGTGGVQELDLLEDYVDRIASDIQVEEPLRVVVDCGNGISGRIAPQVLEEIGCEVVPLYCDVDGTFPNHHPDPSEPENLRDLIMSVEQLDADLGVAFDGDGDRLGVVTRSGRIVYADRVLMLFAEDVLLRNPGATVIYDVKCTGHLAKVILSNGGSPLMWKTGHSLMKAKMKETHAALGGEMSGHFFFQERWYGFDDGIYAAARLLEILASSPGGAEVTLENLPDSHSTPELKIPLEDGGAHFDFMERFATQAAFPEARITTIDGIRADYDDGWGLVRASNTTPSLVLRFDAESEEALTRIQEAFRSELLKVRADLAIPF